MRIGGSPMEMNELMITYQQYLKKINEIWGLL